MPTSPRSTKQIEGCMKNPSEFKVSWFGAALHAEYFCRITSRDLNSFATRVKNAEFEKLLFIEWSVNTQRSAKLKSRIIPPVTPLPRPRAHLVGRRKPLSLNQLERPFRVSHVIQRDLMQTPRTTDEIA